MKPGLRLNNVKYALFLVIYLTFKAVSDLIFLVIIERTCQKAFETYKF